MSHGIVSTRGREGVVGLFPYDQEAFRALLGIVRYPKLPGTDTGKGQRRSATLEEEQKKKGPLSDLSGDVLKAFLREIGSLSLIEIQCLIGAKRSLSRRVEQTVQDSLRSMVITFHWERFYRAHGIEIDLRGMSIAPIGLHGVFWPIVVAQGVSYGWISEAFGAEIDPAYNPLYHCIDGIQEHRNPLSRPYVVYVSASLEPDAGVVSSADDLQEGSRTCITLRELMLLAQFVFFRTGEGEHLDIHSRTLCAGTRFKDGRVPVMHWSKSKSNYVIGSCDSKERNYLQNTRPRLVVS